MRVHIAFCPGVIPRPQLGIASLKGYVEGKSSHRVVGHDFNLAWHRQWLEGSAGEPGVAAMAKAVRFFEAGGAPFFQQKPYNAHATAFYRGALAAYEGLERQARAVWAGQAPEPAWVADFAERLLAGVPDLVGFSVCYLPQVVPTLLIARAVRRLLPGLPMVFGGSLTTTDVHLEEFLAVGDYVVSYEGERPLLALLDALEQGTALDTISSLAWKEGEKVRQTPPSSSLSLEDLPFPDFSDFDLTGYFTPEPVVPILTSRGCFWRRCSFCVHHGIYADSFRVAPISRVVDEIAAWVARGVTMFQFVDEMMPANRYVRISREILRRGLRVHFFGLARPTRHFNRETFEAMAAAGCRFLLWGVESGCQRVLDLIDKGTTREGVGQVLGDAAAAGIRNYIFLIVGFPSESAREFRETLGFLHAHRESIHHILSGPFKLEPDSKIAADPERFFIRGIRPDPAEKGGLLYTVSRGMPPERLKALHVHVNTYFYNLFAEFSTWFGLLREHALYFHANPGQYPPSFWKWRVPDPATLALPMLEEDGTE